MAIYRVYAIRSATVAGETVKVLGEQIGGNYPTREAAEAAARASGLECEILHVGGVVS